MDSGSVAPASARVNAQCGIEASTLV